ncbi:carbon-nitrogen hydrolase [Trichoderma citrinoviride]|uniref:Carbon-nitrogen hydrolase n=1 Tax=Trichoderma citrinoviride TaxID=58853 RepID=A0A2T4B063_9HYPO|nr:carbon-nitrogen hydrolase [Trichoderma citrinoviride]PTB62713.1 carbon-nitrogen hydrolase [Trichoderma citrinoviride]
MTPTLKVALAQFQAKPLCVPENFDRAASEIRSAAAQGCHLVVLPEYHLTSWVPEDPTFAEACAASAKYLPRYKELARELNIHIVPGTIVEPVTIQPSDPITTSLPERDIKAGDPAIELHNKAYFIAAATGEILGTYQKKNLWHVERGVLTADKKSPHKAFNVPLPGSNHVVRVGLLICWDLAFPEASRQLMADGAKLVIIPAYWHIKEVNPRLTSLNPDSEAVLLDSVTVARAYENTCAIAFCNAWGLSQIAMPVLGSLGRLGAEKEGCVISDVDLDALEVAESHYKLREDIRGEEWHY